MLAEILAMSAQYMVRCQEAGTLARFDPTSLALWSTLSTVTFHGAPGLRNHIIPVANAEQWARKSYEQTLDMFLRGEASPPDVR